jgi:hypothetical protein
MNKMEGEIIIECTVCLTSFAEVEPRNMNCGHTVCTGCINTMLVIHKNGIECPTCRKKQTGLSKIGDFPVNFSLKHIMQM